MRYYLHDIPGRLRVKNPLIKSYHRIGGDIQRLLKQIDGVNSTIINTVTGSIIVNYDSKTVSSKEILDALRYEGYFDLSKAVTNDQYIHDTVSKAGKLISKTLFGAIAGEALEGSALSFLAVLI
jgi:copper chaperone CopZ